MSNLSTKVLVVFDNAEVESLKLYTPRRGSVHVLVTTRVAPAASPSASVPFHTVFVDTFAPAESALLVPHAEVAETLRHLPLALAVAKAYMDRYDVTPEEYLRALDPDSSAKPHDCPLRATLSVTVARVARESAPTARALEALAFVAPDGVSKRLVAACATRSASPRPHAFLVSPLLLVLAFLFRSWASACC